MGFISVALAIDLKQLWFNIGCHHNTQQYNCVISFATGLNHNKQCLYTRHHWNYNQMVWLYIDDHRDKQKHIGSITFDIGITKATLVL